jgi:hypothetical protein
MTLKNHPDNRMVGGLAAVSDTRLNTFLESEHLRCVVFSVLLFLAKTLASWLFYFFAKWLKRCGFLVF